MNIAFPISLFVHIVFLGLFFHPRLAGRWFFYKKATAKQRRYLFIFLAVTCFLPAIAIAYWWPDYTLVEMSQGTRLFLSDNLAILALESSLALWLIINILLFWIPLWEYPGGPFLPSDASWLWRVILIDLFWLVAIYLITLIGVYL